MDKKTFVKEWIKDLRSGRFNQCKSQLCKRDKDGNASFCCLGVAAMTGRRLGIKDAYKDISTKNIDRPLPGLWFIDIMGESNPSVFGKRCTSMNDTDGMKFNEIANALEEYFDVGK